MNDRIGNPGKTVAVAMVGLALLTGCSRASLLGGPGPEIVHHESPAASERLAVAEPVRKFKNADACRAHLATLGTGHGAGEVVQIAQNESRAYASEPWGDGEIHHEYSCVGKQLSERSWKTGPGHAAETHHESDGGETH